MALSFNHFLILVCILYVKSREERYNRCATWRDDLLTLMITCRVDNLSIPVTILHAKTGTHINCTIQKENSECYPKGKNISVDRHNHTVSIQLIEQKKGGLLQGKWQCQQGKMILGTNVSYIDGIISDSWVHIRGKKVSPTDGDKYVIVECSSCRTPHANYVEFHVNDHPEGSMFQNKSIGLCTYKGQQCTPPICNCSSTENMYSLRLPLTSKMTDIACEMHFQDELRKGKYSTLAKIKIIEKGILYDEAITEVIVKNKYKYIMETKNKTYVMNETGMVDNTDNNEQPKPNKGISKSLIWVVVFVTLFVCISIAILVYIKRKFHCVCKDCETRCNDVSAGKEKRTEEKRKSLTEFENEEYECIPLVSENAEHKVVINRKKIFCQTCESTDNINNAVSYCINCGDYLCFMCNKTHENMCKSRGHVVQLYDLPNHVSPLVCKKHNKMEFEIYCMSHEEILCVECFKCNNFCQWKFIDKICEQNETWLVFKYELPKLIRQIESKIDDLDKFHELFTKYVTDATSKINQLKTEPIGDEQCTLPDKQKYLLDQLKAKQTEYNTKYAVQKQEAEKLLNQVRNEVRILTFVSNNVSDKLLLVHIHMAVKRVESIEKSLGSFEANIGRTEIKIEWSFNEEFLGKFVQSFIRLTSNNFEKSTRSQTPKYIEMYSRQEKQFKLHFSNLAYVDGSLALISNKETKLIIYNIKTETSTNVDIEFPSHDIKVIPSTKRVLITCENEDKLQEVDLENNGLKIWDIKYSAKAAIAITPSFILLGVGSKRIIRIFQHNGKCVLNIKTNADADRLCYFDDRISYLSLKSETLISIDVTGEHLHESGKSKPVDILTTNSGHHIVLEESKKVLSKSSMDGKELALNFEQKLTWTNAIAICSNGDASELFVLSYNETATVIHMYTLPNTLRKQKEIENDTNSNNYGHNVPTKAI